MTCPPHRPALLLCVIPFLLAGAAAADDKAAEAAAAFDSLYGADLKRVAATRDAKDDLELAGRLLAAAKVAGAVPELLVLLCDKAYDLAAAAPGGHGTALAAMELEAAKVPGRAAACAERIVQIRQEQFTAARGTDIPKAGEALIDALLAAADAKAVAGAAADAEALCRRAQTVALAVRSDRRGLIESRLAAGTAAAKARRDLEDLKKQLAANPKDAATREKLVRLYLVELDDPAEAARHLDGVLDASLCKYVPASARPIDAAPELACVELGDWYRTLGEGASPAAKAAMFGRARAYYSRFLAIHAAEDLNRTKVTLALKKIEDECARTGIALAVPAAPAGPSPLPAPPQPAAAKTVPAGQWLDLLPLVDLARDAFGGKWVPRPDGLASVDTKARNRLGLPVVVQGDYEWETRFVGAGGAHHVAFIFSVSRSRVIAQLIGGGRSGLALVNGKDIDSNETSVGPIAFNVGQEYTVLVRVQTSTAPANVALSVDGKPYISWTGDPSALSLAGISSAWSDCPGSVGLGATTAAITFRGSRLRALSGEAKPLRQAPSAPVGAGKAVPVGQW